MSLERVSPYKFDPNLPLSWLLYFVLSFLDYKSLVLRICSFTETLSRGPKVRTKVVNDLLLEPIEKHETQR